MSQQSDWRWCQKCQGLAFGGNAQLSHVCPAGGVHDHSLSFDYILRYDDPSAPGQAQWRWCSKCQGLFFNGEGSLGVCPAGEGHNGTLAFNYILAERH